MKIAPFGYSGQYTLHFWTNPYFLSWTGADGVSATNPTRLLLVIIHAMSQSIAHIAHENTGDHKCTESHVLKQRTRPEQEWKGWTLECLRNQILSCWGKGTSQILLEMVLVVGLHSSTWPGGVIGSSIFLQYLYIGLLRPAAYLGQLQ